MANWMHMMTENSLEMNSYTRDDVLDGSVHAYRAVTGAFALPLDEALARIKAMEKSGALGAPLAKMLCDTRTVVAEEAINTPTDTPADTAPTDTPPDTTSTTTTVNMSTDKPADTTPATPAETPSETPTAQATTSDESPLRVEKVDANNPINRVVLIVPITQMHDSPTLLTRLTLIIRML